MWSILRAKDILDTALRARGLEGRGLELLSFRKSAVYLLPHDEVVVRISRPEAKPEGIKNGLELASWLEEKDFPALRPLRGIPLEPLEIYGSQVTFWRYQKTYPGEIDPIKAGELLRSFHDLTRDYHGDLQVWRPLGDAAVHLRFLQEKGSIAEDDLEMLWNWQYYLEGRLASATSQMGTAPIHGNAHPGSFLLREDGTIVLSDFDFFAQGPLEWDLVPWAVGPRRYGKSRQSFLDFQKSYGVDIINWSGFVDYLLAREFLLTTFRLSCDSGSQLSQEASKRLAYWRKEDSSPWV